MDCVFCALSTPYPRCATEAERADTRVFVVNGQSTCIAHSDIPYVFAEYGLGGMITHQKVRDFQP